MFVTLANDLIRQVIPVSARVVSASRAYRRRVRIPTNTGHTRISENVKSSSGLPIKIHEGDRVTETGRQP